MRSASYPGANGHIQAAHRKFGPSRTMPPSRRMPHSSAIAVAVITLSPVTIRTVMPAFCTSTIDSFTF